MPNNENGTEKIVKITKKLLRNKLVRILLIIVFTIILLVSCMIEILEFDTADRSSKINKPHNIEIYTEHKLC